MADRDPTAGKRAHVGRRRLLGGAGASALAAAVAVFGRPGPASALVAFGCCQLFFHPTLTLAACKTDNAKQKITHYVWTCSQGGTGFTCSCCERYVNGNQTASAAVC